MYEFGFTTELLTEYNENVLPPQLPIEELQMWLNSGCINWEYIFDMGCLWGIKFNDEADAMAFKLRWL